MISEARKILAVLPPRLRRLLLALALLMLLGSVAEVISLGAIVPFLTVLVDPQAAARLPIVGASLSKIPLLEQRLWVGGGFLVALGVAAVMRIILLSANIRFTHATGFALSRAATQAMADDCINEAMAAMEGERQARNPRLVELADEICSVFHDDSEMLLYNELLDRLSGNRVYMSRMVSRLRSSGHLHCYGPMMSQRYSRTKFTDTMREKVDREIMDAADARKQRKAEYQRARLVERRGDSKKPIRKTAENRATRLKPKPKTAQELGMRPAKDTPAQSPIRSASVVIPDGVRRVVAPAPVDYRYHVDPSHRGEFSQQWQKLRSAA